MSASRIQLLPNPLQLAPRLLPSEPHLVDKQWREIYLGPVPPQRLNQVSRDRLQGDLEAL